ncbi:TetR/AcrR family transcriptional regulator [Myceligenerans indicum]|uniref:TetR/AcrR family transcriptional regulator n=1 Tax=Myceligenerans indicum TaxID=2593663 RepID=A0ABS1LFQ3_9MICO|nr:TetR/AcrR family transcriptional regulator [Myceligenerans indicum]MBL0885066.1 TetR/AcrR family transcriptional regulator [Myceligenerans indicum]
MESATRGRSSEATKAAILAAARRAFSEEGYDRATIRSIAAEARIDPSMVMRYFGTKEALYATAIDVSLSLPDPAGVPRGRIGEVVMRGMCRYWEEEPIGLARLRRALADPASAAAVRASIADEASAIARHFCEDEDEAHLRGAMAGTQVLGISLSRYILRVPEIVALSCDELVALYAPTLQRYFCEPLPGVTGAVPERSS